MSKTIRVTDHGERESKEKELEVWEFRGTDHRQVIQLLCVPLIPQRLRDPCVLANVQGLWKRGRGVWCQLGVMQVPGR